MVWPVIIIDHRRSRLASGLEFESVGLISVLLKFVAMDLLTSLSDGKSSNVWGGICAEDGAAGKDMGMFDGRLCFRAAAGVAPCRRWSVTNMVGSAGKSVTPLGWD
jgi:hypothetical protein